MSSSNSSLINLVPVFNGENWAEFAETMEAFLLSQGRWWVIAVPRAHLDSMVAASSTGSVISPAEGNVSSSISAGGNSAGRLLAAGKNVADWDADNAVVLGTLRLRVAASFRQTIKAY
ncbi:hypothetical protein K488DRAFT_92267 [Vararia minispora EC-137]|uniref:Uncharacterized protein n=1 Tax=Vararia minispora EC-137 TaxID=1314806 RepID=A0ACB8Q4A0_9AGAM|nr:hypothetical protein K488DRAFT_92267 [Vararia minispora EC-137]